jgi:predicted HAD superfamily Cof-like phosphohydrolase
VRTLRVKLLEEEIHEYLQGEENNDLVNIAQELADICYIAMGTAITYGIPQQALEPMIFAGLPIRGEPQLLDSEFRATRVAVMKDYWDNYLLAEQSNNIALISEALDHVLTMVAGTSYAYGIPLYEVFLEVHRANMSKALPDGTVKRREDGKVLKSENFKPADVKSVLKKGRLNITP